MRKNKLLYGFLPLTILPFAFLNTSCSSYASRIDSVLKEKSIPWYNELTSKPFSENNWFCDSETQGINMYAIQWGYFWNNNLHHKQVPINTLYKDKEVRGVDWKYVSTALDKSVFPEDKHVYHGVEYQEDEFYDQLQQFIIPPTIPGGGYDFSQCIGKTITSYGFISTTFDLQRALDFSDGWIFDDQTTYSVSSTNNYNKRYHLPLKEPVVFDIKINTGYKGAAYLADFEFNGEINYDNQVLINRLCQFKINSIEKKDGINIFHVDLLDRLSLPTDLSATNPQVPTSNNIIDNNQKLKTFFNSKIK